MSKETTEKIGELTDSLKQQMEKLKPKPKPFAILLALFISFLVCFPSGLLFIALCRWLWTLAFPG